MRVYSLIYDLIFVGKHLQPFYLEEMGSSEALKTRVLELAD
jgi:hypothetical protein